MGIFQPIQNPVYVTPAQIRRILGTKDQSTNDDDILLSFCDELSRKIDWECNRQFFPRYQEIRTDWPGTSFRLDLPDDLLQMVTLTNGDGNVIPTITTIGSTTVQVQYLYPSDQYPKLTLEIGINSGIVFLYVGTPQQAIKISALWGFPYYENTGIWKTATTATVQDTTQQNATQSTLLVQTGSFYTGQTLYIDDEFQIIQSVTAGATTDTLGVLRGACGSTATTHANGAVIYQVLVHPTIFRAAERLVGWSYRLKDSADGYKDSGMVGIKAFGNLLLPNAIPADVLDIIKNLRRGHNYR